MILLDPLNCFLEQIFDIHFQRFDTAVERFSDRSEIFQRFKLAVTDRMSKLKRSSEYTQILRMN